MGYGKSSSTLAAYKDLVESGDARHALVVAPPRVARSVWSSETKRWADFEGIDVRPIIGTPQQRFDALRTPADVHTISRHQLEWLEAQYIEGRRQFRKWHWDTVILDEAQGFRSQSSARWKAMRRLRRLTSRVIELSATPAPNGYSNIWSQLFLLDLGKRLGLSEDAYRSRWFDPPEHPYGRWKLKPGAKAEIHDRIKDIVFALPDDQLPPVPFNEIRVQLSPAALTAYKRFRRELLVDLGRQRITAVNGGAAYGKLLQLANGAVYYDKEGRWEHFHDEKINALIELLADIDGPTLICYGFKHDLERLKTALTAFSKYHHTTWDVLNTQKSEDDWNAGKTDHLLLHPASAGHGLNLQFSGAETVIWFGLTNDLELWQQAPARLFGGHRRIGRNGIIHAIVAEGTIDGETLELLNSKDADQSSLIEAIATLSRQQS